MKRLDGFGRWSVIAGLVCAAVGLEALVYWWHTYWAQYVATNVLPPSLWTLVGVAISHLRLHAKIDAAHQELHDKLDSNHRELKDHVKAWSGRRDRM